LGATARTVLAESPGNDRFVVLDDPQGATLAIHQSN
jgi:hypothetical protein